ncbi:MAG: efflux RND transporter permease subunit [Clostridia bacterium]|nr:efflux RND transporter permease subunit [Clostridia bacterium]
MSQNQAQLDQNIKENWFAKIGVHKPYTVFVCIMAILILGVFAFSKMTVDLFPSMNLPYAVVVLNPDQTKTMNRLGALLKTYTDPSDPDYDATKATKFQQDFIILVLTNARAYYDDDATYNADKDDFMAHVNDPVALQGLTANQIAQYYLKQGQTIMAGLVLPEVMPTAAELEKLTTDATQAVANISGIKNTRSTTMLSMGVVMMTLEYYNDATVDLTELNMALENMGLDNIGAHDTVYNQQILKIDPTLLPVMFVTVSHTDKAGDTTWFKNNVLDKISATVGVGSISSNIETKIEGQDHNQAWQNSADHGLVDTYSIQIQKTGNAVTAETCANVIVTLDKIKAENPGFNYDITNNQGEYINQTVGSVGENLVVGGLLALLILFLFLRSFKMTLAIGISIPLALVGTFVAMYFMGINLNIISMSGLALAVGMLVDNSVVVLENIFRLRSKGFPLREACIKGASQIMLAMLASSLTTICVFFPMFFLDGLIMQIFTDLVWVVILSLLCSFVVAVMFLPSIVSTFKINPSITKVATTGKPNFWQKMGASWRKFTTGANHVFDKVLRFAIDKKWLTVLLALILFVGSGALMMINGFILLPSTDEGALTVTATLNAKGQAVAEKVTLAQPLYQQVVDVLGNDLDKCVIAYDNGSNILSNGIGMSVEIKLKDQRSLTTDEASEKLYKAFRNFDQTYYSDIDVTAASMASNMVANSVSVTLTVDNSDYSAAFNTLGQFGKAIDAKFADQKENLNIRSIIYESYDDGVQQILKQNGKYAAVIEVKANPSANTNQIQSLMNRYVDELIHGDFKDAGVTILDNGMEGEMQESYQSMGIALAVGFALIYLVMVAIFQSFLMPFIILICVPLGFTGAFFFLFFAGMPLSIPALIGLLILMGVVINNGILAVDYTNQARADGLSVKEALVTAMHTRMRPIFMTALTTILAMVPMAFGWSLFNPGGSSDMIKPLAVVSIGGLLFGTLTTLIVVPAFYAIFCREKKVKVITDKSAPNSAQPVK